MTTYAHNLLIQSVFRNLGLVSANVGIRCDTDVDASTRCNNDTAAFLRALADLINDGDSPESKAKAEKFVGYVAGEVREKLRRNGITETTPEPALFVVKTSFNRQTYTAHEIHKLHLPYAELHVYQGEKVRFRESGAFSWVAVFDNEDLAETVALKFGGVVKRATKTDVKKGAILSTVEFKTK